MITSNIKSLNYLDSGVDIDAGESLVNIIKPLAARTKRKEVLKGIGGFGALFEISKNFKEPVLVSGTDGVGTKLRLAFEWNRHDTVGIDLVAMSVNDILVQGAEPLFFLDYFACGKLSVDIAASVIKGIAKGCELAGCTLIGGETAEMPGMYPIGEYDLAGFAVGAVEKAKIINGETIREGDTILGLASSGAHSNGYSLIRKVLEHTKANPDQDFYGQPLSDAIMAPTRIYVKQILSLIAEYGDSIKGLAHITGGGLLDNIPRILNPGLSAKLFRDSWNLPNLFNWLQKNGNILDEEMYRVFNCGIGMVIIVPDIDADAIMKTLISYGEKVTRIGEVVRTQKNMPQTYVL
ncbi:phosphoribosylformylglycinamidine cyclo-ligase [Candidatus Kinetoplastibacterium oncopeltii TCC290E]|uniref:Phosphoribosylformylglycinamidine cyclo-ligase n=1 Tax=Candidatus Kinetoplastidibacterium stringomonadis TCC290E TaxID=1208920 RepID=M1LWU6_9PROT|nr:phosphoribosylformylglycinamidine cyclo-ligase [Candidatus Kinetoplastibacterium oncopeltii]AGF48541.1 phosphoribosylformylglycinamidine cyclo-ligase [Candidatus Kinetoplastibacterium oncopeltii TCC290E]